MVLDGTRKNRVSSTELNADYIKLQTSPVLEVLVNFHKSTANEDRRENKGMFILYLQITSTVCKISSTSSTGKGVNYDRKSYRISIKAGSRKVKREGCQICCPGNEWNAR